MPGIDQPRDYNPSRNSALVGDNPKDYMPSPKPIAGNGSDSYADMYYTHQMGSGIATNYEQDLRAMYQSQHTDFVKNTAPMLDLLQEEATSKDTVGRSIARAKELGGRVDTVSEHQQQYSSSDLLPSMSKSLQTRTKRNTALMKDSSVSMANTAQRNKHKEARQSMMSIAENLQSSGVAGIAQVSANKTKRDAANKAQSQGMMSQVGAVVGGIAGGIYGGPGGATAGAAIGGAAGSAIGG